LRRPGSTHRSGQTTAGGACPFDFSGAAQVLVDESDAAAASKILANRTDET